MLFSLAFVFAFQIVLCLVVGCLGISLTWCAILGWILIEWWREQTTRCTCDVLPSRGIAAVMDLIAIIYYCVVDPPITTVAHVLAILLGITLETVTTRFLSSTQRHLRVGRGRDGISTPLVVSGS